MSNLAILKSLTIVHLQAYLLFLFIDIKSKYNWLTTSNKKIDFPTFDITYL